MADFTVNMMAFTDRLKASIDDRGESLARVHQATTDLLDGAREFLGNVALEHEARAERVNAFMSNSRAHRCEMVGAMRDSHREQLNAMSEEMRHTLDEASRSRVEEVNAFMAASHAQRCETSKAMRDSHREQLDTMSEELRQTLDEANKTRLETVGAMRGTFKTAQQGLASDLRDAAKAWREFANRGQAASMSEPSSSPTPECHDETKKPKRASQRKSHAKRKTSHA